MFKRKLAVQMYSLRNEIEKLGMRSVLKTVADIGYIGIEPCGFGDLSIPDFYKAASDLGLEITSSHRPWCNLDNINESIDQAGELGLKRVVCGYGPKDFENLDAIKRTADATNTMMQKLKPLGIELFQHNHYWEFERLDGELKYDIYLKYCLRHLSEVLPGHQIPARRLLVVQLRRQQRRRNGPQVL